MEATGTEDPRTEREDFQATADPALMEEADRTAEVKLLTYAELYLLWERQQWLTQDLDFSRDREDWHERIPPGGALPADVRALLVLHRRAEGGRGAGADHAGGADRGPETLPLHPDRRRGASRPLLRALLPRGRRARVRRALADARADLRAPQRELRPPLRRDAEAAHRPALGRARGHRGPGRGGDHLPHGHRGDAGPHRPALHHGLQRTRRDPAGLRRGVPERGPRRAPPRRLRVRLPAREGARGRPLQGRHPARPAGVASGRRRRPLTALGRGGRGPRICSATPSTKRASSPGPAWRAGSR